LRTAIIACLVTGLTTVNIVGIRNTTLASNIVTVGKVLPLSVFVVAGLFFIRLEQLSFATLPTAGALSSSALLLISAFTGFEAVAIAAGEAREPQRHLPFAMLMALGFLTLVYILIQVVCIGTLPALGTSERPLTDASRLFLGTAGAVVISAGALLAMAGTLTVIMLSGPRVLFAMAEARQLPSVLSKTHARFHTPYIAILVTAALPEADEQPPQCGFRLRGGAGPDSRQRVLSTAKQVEHSSISGLLIDWLWMIDFCRSQGTWVSATTSSGNQYIAVVQQRCRMALSRSSHATGIAEGASEGVVQLSVQCTTDVVHSNAVTIWKPSAASSDQNLAIAEQRDCMISSRRNHVARRSECFIHRIVQ
jgi:hypothetical protein